MRGVLTLAAACVAMAIVPAGAAARRGWIFDMTSARGFERITFTSDEATCASFGVCGYSGTVTYRISGTPRGTIVLARGSGGRVRGGATYRTQGVTEATVTPPASGPACTDTVSHRTDVFSMAATGSRFQTLLLTYHGGGDDYLDTRCPGPDESDAAAGGALPEGTFSKADFFNGTHPKFGLSGGSPFKRAGFSATSDWKLRFAARARGCSPYCRIPASRPR